MAKKKTKYIISVKDYETTLKKLISGDIVTIKTPDVYKALFTNVVYKCDSMEELKKFIKKNKYNKKDCSHYWESLVTGGQTLVTLTYDTDDENFVENCCDNTHTTYISSWVK